MTRRSLPARFLAGVLLAACGIVDAADPPAAAAGSRSAVRHSNQTLTPATTATNPVAVQEAASPAAMVLICRGGNLLNWSTYVEQGTRRQMLSLIFQPQTNRVSATGRELQPSHCGFTTQSGYFPPNVHLEAKDPNVREHLASEAQFYSFNVVARHGYYEAFEYRALSRESPAVDSAAPRNDTRIQGTATARTLKVERRPTEPQLQPVSPGGTAPDLERDCTRNGPRISHLRGRITSEGSFTIHGACFGDRSGEVRLIGQFAGGTLRPAVTRWSPSAIVVRMPLLPDTPGHVLSVSVVRPVDGRASAATQGNFSPVMRVVDVQPAAWSPNGQFTANDGSVNVNTGILDNSRTGADATKPPRRKTKFSLTIHAACQLQTLEVPATVGSVHAVEGWDAGPPHRADVEVTWTPRCVVDSVEVPGLARDEWTCAAAFTLKARAACPAGVNPR